MRPQEIRDKNVDKLMSLGFKPAQWLPLSEQQTLRPYEEIAARLYALDALICWVVFSEEQTASQRIKRYMDNNHLSAFMTDDELAIFSLTRSKANQTYIDNIGWYLENVWALAWVLGFTIEPEVSIGQLPNDITSALMYDFLPGLEASVDDILSANQPRSLEEVVKLEDLYYCAHNAVRSAQLGHDTLPEGYHPISDGGAIHERRHSLTWCLSPGISWEDTDLST
ncbi:DUF4272 domain-containing protein [Suttonella sp. R2A3]|uniref:DUF4272 domain-containing protein n=1 Tax=Suttonella sp. R2A3 TaxID=2908648 RepID=UPI001F23B123|nr:DUF4272 domain-containing protein [Suttonella sp. R2A3]UJF25220.1 DUF4272 domain-containing protein [Suttonella sp. R2A3]